MTATQTTTDLASYVLFVNGRWVPAAEGATMERTSPADGRLVGRYARGAAADVEAAVAAARKAFDDSPWPTSPAQERAAVLQREPVGVVAMITPWNFPLLLLAWKVGPAIAAGCTMIAKPASLTPGGALELASVLQDAGLPDGVYNVVTGGGGEVGTALARHPGVDKVAFTGSTEVGREIMAGAAGDIKKVSLELGGKSPNVVFPDADLEQAVRGAYWGIFLNTGQACQAGSRLLVHRELHDQFIDALIEMAAKSRIGDPLDDKTMIGPVVDEGQLKTVTDYIERGREEGAQLLHGGARLTDGELGGGLFVEPTVFDGVAPGMSIGEEEIFGPVLSVMTFEDV